MALRKGFTLAEMIVSVAVIGILVAVVSIKMNNTYLNAKATGFMTHMNSAINMASSLRGRYELVRVTCEGTSGSNLSVYIYGLDSAGNSTVIFSESVADADYIYKGNFSIDVLEANTLTVYALTRKTASVKWSIDFRQYSGTIYDGYVSAYYVCVPTYAATSGYGWKGQPSSTDYCTIRVKYDTAAGITYAIDVDTTTGTTTF